MFNLSSQFALSAGLGYIQLKSSGKDTTISTESTGTATFNNTVSAVPVTLGLYYYIPLFSKSRLSIGGGASDYFTNFDHRHYREDGLGWWITNNWSDSTEVAYYFVERDQPGFGWFKRVVAAIEEPSGSQFRNVRPAEVNFSGFTVRIGLKIKLF